MSPSQGLVDDQAIDATGSGWPASSTLRVTELWIDPNTGGGDIAAGRTDTTETSSTGALGTTYAVQRFVDGGGHTPLAWPASASFAASCLSVSPLSTGQPPERIVIVFM